LNPARHAARKLWHTVASAKDNRGSPMRVQAREVKRGMLRRDRRGRGASPIEC